MTAGVPIRIPEVTAGFSFSCALTANGTAMCWGNNSSGQLGDGTTSHDPQPVPRHVMAPGGKATGDADCDAETSSIDAALVLQYHAGIISTVGCPAAADVNENGDINSEDAALILQRHAGLESRG